MRSIESPAMSRSVTIKLEPHDQEAIEFAARKVGKSVQEFVLDGAKRRAADVIITANSSARTN